MADGRAAIYSITQWSCIRRRSPTFFHTSDSCLLRVNRSLPFVGLSTAICSGSRGSSLASSCEILRTVNSKGCATNRPPARGTTGQNVALSVGRLLHILPIFRRYDRRPVKGRHVASPVEKLRIVLLEQSHQCRYMTTCLYYW